MEREIGIRGESIDLDDFLKVAQVVASGGEAKRLIQGGRVRVNGDVERRRGRRIVLGDRVTIGAVVLVVALDAGRRTPNV